MKIEVTIQLDDHEAAQLVANISSPLLEKAGISLATAATQLTERLAPAPVAAPEVAAPEAESTTRTRTKATKTVVPVKPKMGEKTTVIREFLEGQATEGRAVTPREILSHLRAQYVWAATAKNLANTVHTTLNNLRERGEVIVIDTATGKSYTFNTKKRAPAIVASTATEAPEIEDEGDEASDDSDTSAE